LSVWRVPSPTSDDVLAAIDLQVQARLGFWDAMIAVACGGISSDVLWTEDLGDGQLLRGVRLRNPVCREMTGRP
jgi:predicted nucleic acid-binding protein